MNLVAIDLPGFSQASEESHQRKKNFSRPLRHIGIGDIHSIGADDRFIAPAFGFADARITTQRLAPCP
jgi:hypothetical protein